MRPNLCERVCVRILLDNRLAPGFVVGRSRNSPGYFYVRFDEQPLSEDPMMVHEDDILSIDRMVRDAP